MQAICAKLVMLRERNLGYRRYLPQVIQEVMYLETLVRDGTSADRQLCVSEKTGHLHEVVNSVARETLEGVPEIVL